MIISSLSVNLNSEGDRCSIGCITIWLLILQKWKISLRNYAIICLKIQLFALLIMSIQNYLNPPVLKSFSLKLVNIIKLNRSLFLRKKEQLYASLLRWDAPSIVNSVLRD